MAGKRGEMKPERSDRNKQGTYLQGEDRGQDRAWVENARIVTSWYGGGSTRTAASLEQGDATNNHRRLLARQCPRRGGQHLHLKPVARMKPDTTSQVTARREIVILPFGWQEKEVVKLSSEQNKQFDPAG